ncbi:MAG: undecaprenyl diphosphate synthase family protein [Candidatus Nanohaloarchaea archaeon]|nr:undecaprenyl diphosphate synthase family protein [Candidatus Nanohaloarchaea archaeon]
MDELHLAVIPDGNRRYAEAHGRHPEEGHVAGAETAVNLVQWVADYPEIAEVTAWALSPANYRKRSESEIDNLNHVYHTFAEELNSADSAIHGNEVRVQTIGDTTVLEPHAQQAIDRLVTDTAGYDTPQLTLALNYDAAYDTDQALTAARQNGHSRPLTEDIRAHYEITEVDVLVRYGEDSAHLSGFAPAEQLRQATLYFPGQNWPAAQKSDIDAALEKHEDRTVTEGA